MYCLLLVCFGLFGCLLYVCVLLFGCWWCCELYLFYVLVCGVLHLIDLTGFCSDWLLRLGYYVGLDLLVWLLA